MPHPFQQGAEVGWSVPMSSKHMGVLAVAVWCSTRTHASVLQYPLHTGHLLDQEVAGFDLYYCDVEYWQGEGQRIGEWDEDVGSGGGRPCSFTGNEDDRQDLYKIPP